MKYTKSLVLACFSWLLVQVCSHPQGYDYSRPSGGNSGSGGNSPAPVYGLPNQTPSKPLGSYPSPGGSSGSRPGGSSGGNNYQSQAQISPSGQYPSKPSGGGSQQGGQQGGNSPGFGGDGGTVQCQMREGSDGRYKFTCEGVNPDLVTLKSEHILWLDSASGSDQTVDIEVPNYRIEDLIKAYFKPGESGNNQINVLLKRPEQNWDAIAQRPTGSSGAPQVSLQYEPAPAPLTQHFPDDKPYQQQAAASNIVPQYYRKH